MAQVTRRVALHLSGAALLALAAFPLRAQTKNVLDDSISWDQFLELCNDLSTAQFKDNWDQIAYTKKMESLLLKLRLDDAKIVSFMDRYKDYSQSWPTIRAIHEVKKFCVKLIEFEPNEKIPLHDHPDMTGVIMCTHGRVLVDHFNKISDESNPDQTLLQEDSILDMKSGDTAALTAQKGNIHRLHAKEFSRMIDVFTPPYDDDRSSRVRYYTLDGTHHGDSDDVYAAEEWTYPRFD